MQSPVPNSLPNFVLSPQHPLGSRTRGHWNGREKNGLSRFEQNLYSSDVWVFVLETVIRLAGIGRLGVGEAEVEATKLPWPRIAVKLTLA